MHFRFGDLPDGISFDDLFYLAVISRTYQYASLLRPFLANWIKPWIPFARVPGYERWLFIAWAFGYREIFPDLSACLAMVVTTGSPDPCLATLLNSRSVPKSLVVE
jgi:hypothetical protein